MIKTFLCASIILCSSFAVAKTPEEAAADFKESFEKGLAQLVALSANAADFVVCFDKVEVESISVTELKTSIETCFNGPRLLKFIQRSPSNFTETIALKESFMKTCLATDYCEVAGPKGIETKSCAHLSIINESLRSHGVASEFFTFDDAKKLCQNLITLP